MKTTTLVLMLQIAGILHVGLICAGMAMPRVVNLSSHIATLPKFVRQLFWVYYSFIGLCLLSFGAISFLFAEQLADGSTLARAMCLFFAIFWTVRLIAATFVFDVRPYIKAGLLRLGYHATSVVFIFLPIVYLLAAWKGGPE